jgi:flagellar basal-body rod modification protein FlgD
MEVGPQSSGDQTVTWDGKDNQGNELDPGVYTFSVSAAASNGTNVEATTYVCGTISGVSYVEGMAEFMIGSLQVGLGDIVQILGT